MAPISLLIKSCDITKEFQQKAIQFRGTSHGLKITNQKFNFYRSALFHMKIWVCLKHFDYDCL